MTAGPSQGKQQRSPVRRQSLIHGVGQVDTMEVIDGDRISKVAKLAAVCSAIILDHTTGNVLLTRGSDNGRWCLPRGHMNPGESA